MACRIINGDGGFEEALRQVRRAHELDPLSLIINTISGEVLYESRQYDQAIEQLRRTLELDPNFALAHRWLGEVYKQKAMHQEAIAEFEKALALSDRGMMTLVLGSLGHAYAAAGKKEAAEKVLDELKQLLKQKYVSPIYYFALVCAGLGRKDEAFQWLDKACEERSTWLVFSKVEPWWDSLRSDRRFEDLVRRLCLPA